MPISMRKPKPLPSNVASVLKLMTYLTGFDREMTVNRVLLFLHIARRGTEGVLVKDLMSATGLNQSTVSRGVAGLADKPQRGMKDPLRWVGVRPDHEDPRRVRMFLSERGEQIVNEIDAMLD